MHFILWKDSVHNMDLAISEGEGELETLERLRILLISIKQVSAYH